MKTVSLQPVRSPLLFPSLACAFFLVFPEVPSCLLWLACLSSSERQKQAELAKSREEASRAAQEKRELEDRLKTEAEKTQQAFNKHNEERKRALIAERGAGRSAPDADMETYVYGQGGGPPKLEALPAADLKDRYRAIRQKNPENPRLPDILRLIALKTGESQTKVKLQVSLEHRLCCCFFFPRPSEGRLRCFRTASDAPAI